MGSVTDHNMGYNTAEGERGGGGVSITCSSTIIFILAVVLLCIFRLTPSLLIVTLQENISTTLSTSWPQAPFDCFLQVFVECAVRTSKLAVLM